MKDETKKKEKEKRGGRRKGNNKKLISPDVFEFISGGCGTRRIATVGDLYGEIKRRCLQMHVCDRGIACISPARRFN